MGKIQKELIIDPKEEEMLRACIKKKKDTIEGMIYYISLVREDLIRKKDHELLKTLGYICMQSPKREITILNETAGKLPDRFAITAKNKRNGDLVYKLVTDRKYKGKMDRMLKKAKRKR